MTEPRVPAAPAPSATAPHDRPRRSPRTARRVGGMAAGVLLAAAAGCLPIPHSHVRQPEIAVRVSGPAGRPVAGATVYVYAADYVGGRVHHQETALTDSLGRIAFPRLTEFHPILFLMVDADGPYQWAWCAEAPGFGPERGSLRGIAPAELSVVFTEAGREDRCPRNPTYLHELGLPRRVHPDTVRENQAVEVRP
ncbi:MAG TPA: carboxypeptidase-like regulatory domain-containing protein [Longimicrobium sp.]